MRRAIIVLLCAVLFVFGCTEEEIPDICGLYAGKRNAQYGYGYSGDFYLDIMQCNKNGIAGETEFVSGTSYTIKSFEGEWSDDGETITITFDEIEVLDTQGAYQDTNIYYYEAVLEGGEISGEYMLNDRKYGSIVLKKVEATAK